MTFDVEPETNLMNALIGVGLPVASSCHGDGVCSMCRMKITGKTRPPEEFEINCLKRNKAAEGERLSCQVSVIEDITVETKYW